MNIVWNSARPQPDTDGITQLWFDGRGAICYRIGLEPRIYRTSPGAIRTINDTGDTKPLYIQESAA